MDIVEALRLQKGNSFDREPMWRVLATAAQILRKCGAFPVINDCEIRGKTLYLKQEDKATLNQIINPILKWKNSSEISADDSSNSVLYRAMLGFDEHEMILVERYSIAECTILEKKRPSNCISQLACIMGIRLHLQRFHTEIQLSPDQFAKFFFHVLLKADRSFLLPEETFFEEWLLDLEKYVAFLEEYARTNKGSGGRSSRRGRLGLGGTKLLPQQPWGLR